MGNLKIKIFDFLCAHFILQNIQNSPFNLILKKYILVYLSRFEWIPQEYRVMANRKYIETVMLGILDHTIGVREYVETKTLNLKTRKLEFQLEFVTLFF